MTQSEPRSEDRRAAAMGDVSAPEFAWRVLRLVNVYRILVSVFLLIMFLITDDPRLIGAVQPDLFFATALAFFVFGAVNDFAVTRRWPSLMSQSIVVQSVEQKQKLPPPPQSRVPTPKPPQPPGQ